MEELAEILMRHVDYFRRCGGVTFSGGEPLMQSQFLLELARKLDCMLRCKQADTLTKMYFKLWSGDGLCDVRHQAGLPATAHDLYGGV
ncbi:MAG: hypothetical protein ACLTXL_04690 [Clostridia bacterium]